MEFQGKSYSRFSSTDEEMAQLVALIQEYPAKKRIKKLKKALDGGDKKKKAIRELIAEIDEWLSAIEALPQFVVKPEERDEVFPAYAKAKADFAQLCRHIMKNAKKKLAEASMRALHDESAIEEALIEKHKVEPSTIRVLLDRIPSVTALLNVYHNTENDSVRALIWDSWLENRKLNDEVKYAIAMEEGAHRAGQFAEGLFDKSLLAPIYAAFADDPEWGMFVRQSVLERLSEYDSKESYAVLKEANTLGFTHDVDILKMHLWADQLYYVLQNYEEIEIPLEIIFRLHQPQLLDLARNGKTEDLRRAAIASMKKDAFVQFITTSDDLSLLSLNPEGTAIRFRDKLDPATDTDVLLKIALSNAPLPVREVAIRLIDDEAAVATLVSKLGVSALQAHHLKYLDKKDLRRVAELSPNEEMRRYALAYLEHDNEFLLQRFNHEPSLSMREYITSLIHDEEILYTIVMEDPAFLVQVQAVNNIIRPDLLVRIIAESTTPTVVRNAVRRLADPEKLEEALPGHFTFWILQGIAEAAGKNPFQYLEERGETERYLPLILNQDPLVPAIHFLEAVYYKRHGQRFDAQNVLYESEHPREEGDDADDGYPYMDEFEYVDSLIAGESSDPDFVPDGSGEVDMLFGPRTRWRAEKLYELLK